MHRRKKQKEGGKKRERKYLIPLAGENHCKTKGRKSIDFKKEHDIMGYLRKGDTVHFSTSHGLEEAP